MAAKETVYYDTFDDEEALAAKPESEQELAKYQKLFKETGEKQYWQKMLEIIYSYTRSLVLKQNRGKKFLEKEEIDEITCIASLQFMQRYYTEPAFEVKASFAGLLGFKIREVIKGIKKQKYIKESGFILSLNDLLNDEGTAEIGDMNVRSVTMTQTDVDSLEPEAALEEQSIVKASERLITELEELIADKDNTVDSKLVALSCFYLLLRMKGTKNKHQKEMFLKYFNLGVPEDNVLDSLILHLKKRMTRPEIRD